MKLPAIKGIIDRRILINFRIDPDVMAHNLPSPFRPKLVRGYAIGGICLIRLKAARPTFLPLPWGMGSENAAHRIAVQWDVDGQEREGVYVPRRDTDSRVSTLVGGRLFPGTQHYAAFTVDESADKLSVTLCSDDGVTQLHVSATVAESVPESSVFSSLAEASAFFEAGSLGYSATVEASRFDGLELRCKNWHVYALAIDEVVSSYFEDEARFPIDSVMLDCGLLMRGIDHEWHGRELILS